jgi:hypothetical protein
VLSVDPSASYAYVVLAVAVVARLPSWVRSVVKTLEVVDRYRSGRSGR